jgi:hypothetical protein
MALRPSNAIARWRSFDGWERRQLLIAIMLITAVTISMRLVDLNRTDRWVQRAFPLNTKAKARPDMVARLAQVTAISERHSIKDAKCLSRSITLRSMLARHGVASMIQVGTMRTPDRQFRAHAWVEVDAVCVSDTPEQLAGFVTLGPIGVRPIPRR